MLPINKNKTIIDSNNSVVKLTELIRYRELFYIFSWRDITVRYKQTIIGVVWALLKPILTMIIFTIVFSKIANIKNYSNFSYPLVVFAGLLPWNFFSNAFSSGSDSLISNANLLTKVYFPRIILPISAVLTNIIDLLISFFVLFFLYLYFGNYPSIKIFALPFFIFLLLVFTLSLSIFFSALNVKYRDFKHVIPFVLQLGIYISPIGFESFIIPSELRFIYYLNPLVAIIDGFRWCLLDLNYPSPFNYYFLESCSVILILLFLSLKYFNKVENKLSDII